jgi:hypothetical protein
VTAYLNFLVIANLTYISMLYFNRKKSILVISHFGCGVFDLYNTLLYHSRINGYFKSVPERTIDYNDPYCNYLFKKSDHKWEKRDKIYLDLLFFNYQISCKELLQNPDVDFLFFLGNGINISEKINKQTGLSKEASKKYYCFRLRRMCEMIEKIKNPNVFIEGISNSLNLSKYINDKFKLFPTLDISLNYEPETNGLPESCYERYFSFLMNMKERKKINIF